MLEDFVYTLKRRVKQLAILSIVLGMVCVGLIVFIFGNYEIVYEEYTEDTEYTVEQDSADGGNNTAIIDSEVGSDNTIFVVCGTVIVVAFIVVGGLIIYGKTKNNR